MDILHIIPALGPGGPSRSLLSLTKVSRLSHPHVRHRIAVLQPGEYVPILFDLRREGVGLVRNPDGATIAAEIERATVVLLHFWNTPPVWRLLASGLPAGRFMLWSKVLGAHAPQRLNRRLLGAVAELVLTAPPVAGSALQSLRGQVIPGLVDRQRLAALRAVPHGGFNADYIGTTNRGKMHPRFVEMMARLDIPDVAVRICGGALDAEMAARLAALPNAGRFACLGFVEAIGTVLETSDVFAYPLAEQTYATSDISLQEAMLAGVPPVILPHGGPSRFVVDGRNGIVARSEDEFVAAIEYLYRHPERRLALGREARRSAEQAFPTGENVSRVLAIAERVGQGEKAVLPFGDALALPPVAPAAMLFLISQDWDEAEAQAAVAAWLGGSGGDMAAYADSLDDDAFQVEGGILQWRKAALDDPLLRSWTARWLHRRGRAAEAEREMAEAIRLGAPARAASAG